MRIDRHQLAIIFSHRERHEEPRRPEVLASLRPMRPPGRDRDGERVRAKKKCRHRSPGRAKFKIEHTEGDVFAANIRNPARRSGRRRGVFRASRGSRRRGQRTFCEGDP